MDYNTFWKLNPRKLNSYIKAFEINQKYKLELINYQTWLQGIYFGRAIGASFDKKTEYFKRPIDFKEMERQNKEKQLKTKFEILAINFNKSLKDKGGRI